MPNIPWEKMTVTVGFSLHVTCCHTAFHGTLTKPGQVSYALSPEVVLSQGKYFLTYDRVGLYQYKEFK